ncbi:sensor histidine kinase [Demequina activiva]|uniref:histidine kinase n=1 Tax=Demequina activiva TaxID=1582364 RepID=A0A919Q3Y5_9MICO|nr:HAMP domain-containing sensor histidine kinase [Demequina activiva]GIG54023.1 hypothetical protein Dac01nite_07750 [Demequina activiva]
MLQRLGIRGKILAVVAVPILVLVLAAGFITYGASQDLSAARNSEQLVDTLDAARTLEANLQDERYAAINFVHIIQDTRSKLVVGQNDTEDALADTVARIQEVEGEDAGPIIADLYAALGVTSLDDPLFPNERSLSITPPTEEGGWVGFPSLDEVASMQEGYTAARERVAAVAATADENAGGAFQTLDFRIGFESETATTLFTSPLPFKDDLESVTAQVDASIQSMLGSTEQLADNEANAAAVAALASGQQAVANLGAVRAGIQSGTGNIATYLGFYRGILETIVNSADDVAVAMTDRELVSTLQAYGDVDALIENMKYEKVQFERLIRTGSFLSGEADQVRNLQTRTDLSLEEAQRSTASVEGAEPVPDYGASVGTSATDQQSFESVRTALLRGTDIDLTGQRQNQWPEQVDEELTAYEPLREDLWTDVEDSVAANSQAALLQTVLTAIVAILVLIASVVVALLIARRIVNPLRRLTTTATAVRQELPRLVERVAMPGESVDVSEVQINVESRDEIGTLAEAFNGVNAATLAIAGEQAALRGSISEMFVNVARRDQVLLNRQLSSIDEMERTEDDPSTLTKLFALDHLATRMRRNSESLLVLAGIDTGRRLRRPMPLSDVVRTASSEIELYERVQLELDADPSMLGHSALTAAHLFAELLENATVFSDPGSPVVVRTAHVDGTYVVEIEDSGIGMTEKELVEANNRVASTAASEILGAQRLGLFVVGRIARRVGARVEIRSEEGKGTVATVTMPSSLFASEENVPETHVSTTATDAATHAPAALVSHRASDEISDVPARSTANAGAAYTPAVIEEGASLLGGRGAPAQPEPAPASEPAADPNSIEALIAADAAEAPAGEEANLEELTSGTTGAGLPTRRRREAPAPADADREQQSIVGLPARATDAQLSALEAEQAGGFMPAVSPSEVTPQSAEERASMFRGFRPRRANEPEVPIDPEAESLGHAARRGGLDPAALAASQQAAPVEEAPQIPSLEPDGDEPTATTFSSAPSASAPSAASSAEPDGAGAGIAAVGAAGAFGAAAFFGSRHGDEPSAASAPAANEEFAPQTADAASGDGFAPEAAEAQPEVEQAPEVPTFRMPKFDGAAGAFGAGAGAPAAAAHVADTGASVPSAPDQASAPEQAAAPPAQESPAEYEPALAADEAAGPMVIPMLEGDDAVESEQSADDAYPAESSAPSVPQAETAYAGDHDSAPYGGVESVSLDDPFAAASAPELADAHPSDASAWELSAPSTPEASSWMSPESAPSSASAVEPAPQAASWDAADEQPPAAPAPATEDPAVGFSAGAPAYQQPVQPAQPAQPMGSPVPAASAPEHGPTLDELIQSAVDDDTEQRPGFFSRLFGRGGKKGAAVAGTTAGAVAASQPSASAFEPVTATEPRSQASAPSQSSAPLGGFDPEPVQPQATAPAAMPSLYESVPSVSSAPAPAPWEAQPAPSAQQSAPEPQGYAPAPWEAEPSSPAPAAASAPQAPAYDPEPSPASFAPQESDAPAIEGWAPRQEQPAEDAGHGVYSPDQLARASGWEAAGASALQAAEPEVATSYQPVIQPDSADGGDTDMTSAVFSELSSLAAERPKVEKTRAGLQRRRPSNAAPVEVRPIEDEVTMAPGDRDADAVRSRFSSFYSGTQRARDDVAAFERQTEPAEASDT